jgi:hypothetical protein
MWDIKVSLDPNPTKKGEPRPVNPTVPVMGDITATWTEGEEVFTFAGRSAVDPEGQADFIALATEAHKVWKEKQVANEVVTEEVQERIEQTDPLK